MTYPLYVAAAQTIKALSNCERRGNHKWARRWTAYLERQLAAALPNGAGFDRGCSFIYSDAPCSYLTIIAPFHVMNEHGVYDGWEEYEVHVHPSLAHGFTLTCTRGRDRNGVKGYVLDILSEALNATAPERDTRDD